MTAAVQNRERWAWGALLFISLCLRLYDLDGKPFHHDESIHGWFTHNLVQTGEYRYDPVYHGPVQYFLNATSFLLFGDSDFTARLPAALGGVGLVAMALLLRPRFGKKTALIAGVLLSVSPNLLYYTRFCREDVWTLLGTAGTFLYLDAWVREKRISKLIWASFWAVIAFASKENFYVLCALMAPSVAFVFYEPARGVVFWPRIRRLVDFLEANTVAITAALLFFFILAEILYTYFLINLSSWNPAWQAISYWWGQHKVERVGGPKTFHLPRLLQYEFAVMIPAFYLSIRRFRQLDAVERFLLAWGVSSIAMYAYLGEKTPWLIVHQILPFIPLAAKGLAELPWERFGVKAGVGVMGTASLATAISLSFLFPALTPNVQRAESVVYVQTSPELLTVVDEIERVAKTGASLAASVEGEAGWPLSWYLRRMPVEWTRPTPDRLPPIVICDQGKEGEVSITLGPGYENERIPLRAWWVPETSLKPLKPSPRELLTYLFTRRPWSEIGSQNIFVFRDRSRIPPKDSK